MATLLQATRERLIARDIRIYKELKITRTVGGTDYVSSPVHVEGRPTRNVDRQSQTATLDFTVPNPYGDYSVGKSSSINTVAATFKPLLDDNNKVVYREGIEGSDGAIQWFTVFTGYIAGHTDNGGSIEVKCEDRMSLMLNADAPETSYSVSQNWMKPFS